MSVYEPVAMGELNHRAPRPGVVAVRDAVMLLERPNVRDLGIYSRRSVRGGSGWSLHAVGRAWDVGTTAPDPARYLSGIAQTFVSGAPTLGVCEVITGRSRWTPERGWRRYSGPLHNDHVHVGFTRAFADSPAPPDVARQLVALAWARARGR